MTSTAISRWCGGADVETGPWLLTYDGFDPAAESIRETLCTLANGYGGTRGAAPEAVADAVQYPGSYLAGVYNRLETNVNGRRAEDEALVKTPNWLPLTFRHPGGDWMRPGSGIVQHHQELDLRRGLLTRTVVVQDEAARTTRITSRRLVSQAVQHLAAIETTFEATDFDRVFARMMIAHHNGAIQMAQDVRANGTNSDVKTLATTVIATQTAEVQVLQNILDRL